MKSGKETGVFLDFFYTLSLSLSLSLWLFVMNGEWFKILYLRIVDKLIYMWSASCISNVHICVYIVHMKWDSSTLFYIYGLGPIQCSIFVQVFPFHANMRNPFWLLSAPPERMGRTPKMNCRRGISVKSLKSVSGGISCQRISPIMVRKEIYLYYQILLACNFLLLICWIYLIYILFTQCTFLAFCCLFSWRVCCCRWKRSQEGKPSPIGRWIYELTWCVYQFSDSYMYFFFFNKYSLDILIQSINCINH